MGYDKTTWLPGEAPGLSAVNLNHLETQYEEGKADLDAHKVLSTGVHGAEETTLATLADIVAIIKAGVVTETTGGNGKIAVEFAAAFTSTPVVVVTLIGDVDYYPVITARSTTGFTVKMLRTYHKHSQGNTGVEAAHTHSFSDTSSSAGGHSHTQGVTGYPDYTPMYRLTTQTTTSRFAASVSGGSPTSPFLAQIASADVYVSHSTHQHTNPNTSTKASHTHSVSGTTGSGGGHSHTNPDTSQVNAGNLLATTEVTFSYIAMRP